MYTLLSPMQLPCPKDTARSKTKSIHIFGILESNVYLNIDAISRRV